jgi:hypothetical protein
MSRELLKRAAEIISANRLDDSGYVERGDADIAIRLLSDIEAHLAKPLPEPVVWITDCVPELGVYAKMETRNNELAKKWIEYGAEVIPLYSSPPIIHDKGPWSVSEDGRQLSSYDFEHDVILKVNGDFADDAQRKAYSDGLSQRLNAEQTEQKQLSDQEVMDAIKHISFNEMTAFNIARALEDYRTKR